MEMKSFWHLGNEAFACERDAEKALEKSLKKCQFIAIAERQIIKKSRYVKRGKPLKTSKPEGHDYYIQGQVYTSLDKFEAALEEKGFFILATNDMDENFSGKDMLEVYKSQQSVERGFRFLKSPEFLTSAFFLKKPERIEALLMIMTLCLLIYCALEYKIRKNLREQNHYFKDQKNKDTQRPTARWVFFCFNGISVLKVRKETELIVNVLPRHKIILTILGDKYLRIYSQSG
jgi:transposase